MKNFVCIISDRLQEPEELSAFIILILLLPGTRDKTDYQYSNLSQKFVFILSLTWTKFI